MNSENIPAQYKPDQQKVVDERNELSVRIEELQAHIGSDLFLLEDVDERSRKLVQLRIMRDLSEVLGHRIEAFK